MTLKEANEILKRHNLWRRGAEMENPTQLGIAIDVVTKHIDDEQ